MFPSLLSIAPTVAIIIGAFDLLVEPSEGLGLSHMARLWGKPATAGREREMVNRVLVRNKPCW